VAGVQYNNGNVTHEERKDCGDDTASAPDPKDVGLESGVASASVDEVGGCVTNREVEEPLRSGGQTHALGPDLVGIDLGRDLDTNQPHSIC
jgi:hypothetical protein